MTSEQIQKYIEDLIRNPSFRTVEEFDRLRSLRVLWEIAFQLSTLNSQLALFNEHNARMETRYMELTEKAVKSPRSKVQRRKEQKSNS